MANSVLTLRMKYRKYDEKKLNAIIEDENSSELEVKIAQEFLDKLASGSNASEEKKAPKKAEKKPTPKKVIEKEEVEDDDPDPNDGSREAAMKRQGKVTSHYESEEQLSPEEEARLKEAEEQYEERQKNRKTPSKSDKTMRKEKATKAEKTPRETKRQNLEESTEVSGMKVGSKVTLKDDDTVGEITRIYKSGDGKEKCMVKFGDDKPIKKRVTALTLVAEEKAAPAKKTPKKK